MKRAFIIILAILSLVLMSNITPSHLNNHKHLYFYDLSLGNTGKDFNDSLLNRGFKQI